MIDENLSENSQETEQESSAKTPDTSAAEQGAEQQQGSSTNETSATNQVKGDKEIGNTTTLTGLNEKKSSKMPDKGFGDVNTVPSEATIKNLFGQEKTDKGGTGEFPNQSAKENEENKYRDIPTHILENIRNRNIAELKVLNKKHDDLLQEREGLQQDLKYTFSLEDQRKIKNKLAGREEETKQLDQKIRQHETENSDIDAELEERDASKNKNRNNENTSELSEETEIISPQALFKEDEDIENAVFYVATLFPGINTQDFKSVVGYLLQGRKNISADKSFLNNDFGLGDLANNQPIGGGNIGVDVPYRVGIPLNTGVFPNYHFQYSAPLIKEPKTKELTEIWQESFDKPDQYLKKCHLKVERQNGKQVINFSPTKLREDFLLFFQNDQFFYFEQQLRRTQKLDLLLDNSEEVADNAINLAVITAVYYPNNYAEDWLIELFIKIAKEDKNKQDILLIRLSRLIYRLQIETEYSHSETIAQKFLDRLIYPQYRTLAFLIIKYLIHLHLRTKLLGIQSARKILKWLRELLDSDYVVEEKEDINNKYYEIKSDIYNLLEQLLWDSGYHLYIYELLEILKEWLPEKDISSVRYSQSNKAGLLLLFAYCGETTLKLDLKWYGKGYYVYPLFAPLKGSPDSNVSEEFNTLVNWLLYPSSNGELAIKDVLKNLGIDENNRIRIIFILRPIWTHFH
ncbi:MAG: hypothetical protein V7K67_02530 [Nostoc sp.]|uniref:hypothetical protein n=1 Tax=Nostoc sp. TaxID=1180 RepID=UPI002FFBBF84